MAFGRQALGTGRLDPAAASQTRTLIAIGVSQVSGPRAAPGRAGPPGGRPGPGAGRSTSTACRTGGCSGCWPASWSRPSATWPPACDWRARAPPSPWACAPTSTWRWPSTWPGRGTTCCSPPSRAFSAATIHSRRFELPLLHLAAGCVPAGRGAAEEAERHARLAEEAAASLDYGQERLYAGMARALVCQAAGDYLGMADALGPWQDDATLDGRSRVYAVLWRPLLVEGLVGSGQLEQAAAVLGQLRADSGQVSYLRPALAWLEGWLAEQRGDPDEARADLPARRGHRRHRTARCTRPGCCWPTAGCCGAPASGGWRSSGCGRPATCTRRCAPRRSSPGPRRNWPPATCPAARPRSSRSWP